MKNTDKKQTKKVQQPSSEEVDTESVAEQSTASAQPVQFIPGNFSSTDWVNILQAMAQMTHKRPIHEVSDSEEEQPQPKTAHQDEPQFNNEELVAPGGMNALLLEAAAEKAEMNKEGNVLPENLAAFMNLLFKKKVKGAQAKEICEKYPPPKNVPRLRAPHREAVVDSSIDDAAKADVTVRSEVIKKQDDKLRYLQQDIVSAMSAVAEIGIVMYQRLDADPELDQLSGAFGDAMRLMSVVVQDLTKERRKVIGRALKPQALQHLNKTAAESQNPEALFGGNIAEAMRDFDAAKKAAKAMVKEAPQKKKPTPIVPSRKPQHKKGFKKNWHDKAYSSHFSHSRPQPTATAKPQHRQGFQKPGQRQ